jgi:3-methyladenine DNA glycosylase/8-oxoguanine DNA glycosylase
VLVAVPEPFDFALTTERFRAFGDDLVNRWTDGRVVRVLAGREVAIWPADGGVEIDAPVAAEALRFVGGGLDLLPLAATDDPVLARLAAELRGLRPAQVPDPIEALVTAITSQQISLRAASAIRGRLIRALGVEHDRCWAFPTRERLAAAEPEGLIALGFSRSKAAYTVGLARSEVDFHALAGLPDEDVKLELVSLPGIGEWTADWFLARHLGRPDAWPAGDLALRRAVSDFYLGGRAATIDEVRRFGERFAGYRNLAAHYLLVGARFERQPPA